MRQTKSVARRLHRFTQIQNEIEFAYLHSHSGDAALIQSCLKSVSICVICGKG